MKKKKNKKNHFFKKFLNVFFVKAWGEGEGFIKKIREECYFFCMASLQHIVV